MPEKNKERFLGADVSTCSCTRIVTLGTTAAVLVCNLLNLSFGTRLSIRYVHCRLDDGSIVPLMFHVKLVIKGFLYWISIRYGVCQVV